MRPFFRTAATGLAAAVALPLMATTAQAATPQSCTWTGGGGANNRFSVAANWRCTSGAVPTANAALVFPGTAEWKTVVNDQPSSIYYRSITGTRTTSGALYQITGNQIRVAGALSNLTVKAPVTLVNYLTVTDADIWGAVNVGSYPLILKGFSSSIINGSVTGTGNITSSTTFSTISASNANYKGRVVITTGKLALSASIPVGGVVSHPGTSLELLGTTVLGQQTLNGTSNPITLSGGAFSYQGYGYPKLMLGSSGGGAGGALPLPLQDLTGRYAYPGTFTYNGRLTVVGNSPVITPGRTTVTMTGTAVATGFSLVPDALRNGTLNYRFTSNTSNTPNRSYAPVALKRTYNDALPTMNVGVSSPYQVTINGTRASATVYGQSTMGQLRGNLTVSGRLNVQQNGLLHPGAGLGKMWAGSLEGWGGTIQFDIASGTTYSRIEAKSVYLSKTKLSLAKTSTYTPVVGNYYELIRNSGTTPTSGTFAGLAEGARFSCYGNRTCAITYKGGTGNDVLVKVVA